MKHKFAVAAVLIFASQLLPALAGPQFFISIGGGACQPRPVCYPAPVCWPPQTIYYQAPFYGPPVTVVPAGAPVFTNQQVVTPVYQVAAPVFVTQPVQVINGTSFRWTR